MNETLENLQFATEAFRRLRELSTRSAIGPRDDAVQWVTRQKELTEERKVRLRFIYEQRKAGKIFRLIGQELGISTQQATFLYARAERLHKKGFLYSSGLGDPRYEN